ncbi:MAG: sigma-70 family RNA polymerase sigma factor [Oscillospiraceae bacterium]|nr:sigma-70 family RNA polymerase sigma factor [Oscillospiraceae bacterium]
MISVAVNWETVYQEYAPKVTAYIRSRVGNPADVEDLCADVFLNVMRSKEQFSGEPKAVSSWIYMITRHTVAGYYRSNRSSEEIPETLADETDVEAEVLNAETLGRLADALEQLDERERDVIVLHYYSEKKLTEIAEAMDLSYPYIKKLHKKALDRLKVLMR